jgi:hypothetical protein
MQCMKDRFVEHLYRLVDRFNESSEGDDYDNWYAVLGAWSRFCVGALVDPEES